MWLTSKHGFLSIVKNTKATGPNDALLVRARVREDLEDFSVRSTCGCRAGADIERSFMSDYPWRTTASREAVGRYAAQCVEEIDYPSFKDAVGATDPERARVYVDVWAALIGLESGRTKAPRRARAWR